LEGLSVEEKGEIYPHQGNVGGKKKVSEGKREGTNEKKPSNGLKGYLGRTTRGLKKTVQDSSARKKD